MPRVGEVLQETREAHRLSLADAEAATKIRQKHLLALEEDDYGRLPGGVFTRGLLQTYATYLGLNADDLLKQYDQQQPATRRDRTTIQPVSRAPRRKTRYAPSLALVFFIMAISAIIYAVAYRALIASPPSATAPTPPISTPTALPATAAVVAPLPTSTAATTPTPPAATAVASDGIKLDVQVLAAAWMLVTVDGRQEYVGTLPAGTTRSWQGKQSVRIWCGNSSQVMISPNGKPSRALAAGDIIIKEWDKNGNERVIDQ